MKKWISFPRRESFFGPATHMYHAHPPTGWSAREDDLRPPDQAAE